LQDVFFEPFASTFTTTREVDYHSSSTAEEIKKIEEIRKTDQTTTTTYLSGPRRGPNAS